MSEQLFYNIVGLIAPLFFTGAYIMTAIGKWDGTMVRLHLCNFIGAATMLVSLSHNWNLPMVIMEVCWGSVAIYGLIKSFKIMSLKRH